MAKKNVKLVKHIEGILTDLMILTGCDNVIYAEGVTLANKLAEILSKTDALGPISTKNEIAYADLAAALKTLIDGKATKGTTLAAYGINDAYTKTQIDALIAGVWIFKGVKDYQSQLPTTGNRNGDVWQVKYAGTSGTVALDAEFAWNGSAWINLGSILTVDLSGYVPTNRTINGKALSGNVTLAATDVGAVPTSRTVNGKALTVNITLSAADVGAVPTTRKINNKPLSADVTLTAADVGAGRFLTGSTATPPADITENDLYIQLL